MPAPHQAPIAARPARRATSSGLRHPLRLPLAFFGVTMLLILAHQGRVIEMFYPVGAFAIAAWFYWRSPAHYLGFVCWLFFLSPEVRRLADFMNGSFNPQSPVMIASMLAVALSGLSLIKHAHVLGQRRAAPLVLIVLALFYAYIVGMTRAGPAAATFTLVNWLFPVLIGFRLVVTWRDYPLYHRVLLKTFTYGGFVMGAYGVIQYVSPPPWDAFWLLASQMESEGHPVPFAMRVSSTMNSSGAYATTIMVVLLMLLAAPGKTKMLTGLVAIPSLLFTSVRGAWGGFVVGLLYPLAMLDGRSRMRMIAGLLGFAMLCAPVAMIGDVSDKIMQRFDSLSNLGKDDSYQVRAQFYRNFLSVALTDIAGQGLGTTGLGTKLADNSAQLNVVFDSGLMEVPFVMGWPGTLLYTTGILMLMWRAFRASLSRSRDRFAISGVGVALAIFAMMVFVNTLVALPGMFFFIGVIMPAIGQRYAREMRAAQQRQRVATVSGAEVSPASGVPAMRAMREVRR
ncbi:hypothetical protein [Paraburkholderia sp.]|uniref:hypothetical protein n=1 Tax=Paraburkholderia sp. TaxID=1926495 RepID=UPI003D6FFA6A